MPAPLVTQTSLHFTPAITPDAGGPAYSVPRLCQALNKLGNKAIYISLANSLRDFQDSNITFTPPLGLKRLGYSPKMCGWLSRNAHRYHPSVFHCHGIWVPAGVAFLRYAFRHSIPTVLSPRGMLSPWALSHGSRIKRFFWHLYQRKAIVRCSAIHATSELEKDEIRQLGFRTPIAVIPNGIDIPPYIAKQPTESKTALYIGRLHPKKGIELLLKTWSNIGPRFRDWNLRIVGGSRSEHAENRGYLNQLKQLATRLGLKQVTFEPYIFGNQKLKLFSDASLCVLPSYSENFGLVVAESLASGTAVLATTGTPWRDLALHDAGLCVSPDLDSISHGLEVLMAKSFEQLSQMGLKGRVWMENEFKWAEIARKISELYCWIENRQSDHPTFIETL
jgi:glycosyltransferase involved in cell wall biosynthesis